MFSQADLFNAMQTLEVSEQIDALEAALAEHGIEETADALAMCLMGIMMDLEGGKHPADLVGRAVQMTEQVRIYNQRRFGS